MSEISKMIKLLVQSECYYISGFPVTKIEIIIIKKKFDLAFLNVSVFFQNCWLVNHSHSCAKYESDWLMKWFSNVRALTAVNDKFRSLLCQKGGGGTSV